MGNAAVRHLDGIDPTARESGATELGRVYEMSSRYKASALLSVAGVLVAGYLAACQWGRFATVWDPIFGSAASERVLHSWVSRRLPIPDAALGLVGYCCELILSVALLFAEGQGRLHVWLLALYRVVAAGMAAGGLFLLFVQAISVKSFCTLCLLSAMISWVLAALALAGLGSASAVLRQNESDA